MDKAVIRKQIRKKRLDLDKEMYVSKSIFIINKVKEHPFIKVAKCVGIYVSFNQEVNTLPYLEELFLSKRVCVPKIINQQMVFYQLDSLEQLQPGTMGILEPQQCCIVPREAIDAFIVPIVAYDVKNNRIGYGGGYYDRYLQGYQGKTIGIAFDFQKIEPFEPDEFDYPLDVIITEKS